MISAKHLSKHFGSRTAVEDLSFEVKPGEILGFLGPNGAGKTTTLRILCGYLPPSSGNAKIGDYDLEQNSLEARRQIGYLPENFCAPTELRVGEYLRYRARLKGLGRRVAVAEVQKVMELLSLGERSRQLFGELSKGYRQRVGLADALLGNPSCLLLDEPFGGLDPLQRQEFRNVLKKLAEESKAILFSSHVLPEVQEMADQLLIIKEGRKIAIGTSAELMQKAEQASRLIVELNSNEGDSLASAIEEEFPSAIVDTTNTDALLVISDGAIDRIQFFNWLAQRPEGVVGLKTESPNLDALFQSIIGNQTGGPK